MKIKIILTIFIVCILIPYIGTIFFLRTTSLFILLPLYFFALVGLIITTIWLCKLLKERRKILIFSSIASVVIFVTGYGYLLGIADFVFFKLREEKLNQIVFEIQQYKKIHQMTDGQRSWKSINSISFTFDTTKVDTSSEYGRKYPMDYVLKKEKIDRRVYENLRKRLIEVDLIEFTFLEDGTISFTIDGFLDNCDGVAYSKSGLPPKHNNCGRIIHWEKLTEFWYFWYTT